MLVKHSSHEERLVDGCLFPSCLLINNYSIPISWSARLKRCLETLSSDPLPAGGSHLQERLRVHTPLGHPREDANEFMELLKLWEKFCALAFLWGRNPQFPSISPKALWPKILQVTV